MKEGDIVIRIEGKHNGMKVGDMGIVSWYKGNALHLFENTSTFAAYKHRLATPEEVAKFPQETLDRYLKSVGKSLPVQETIYQIF